jgi:8-oxoguanine deaminase
MVQIALAPCSPFSVSQPLMKETADLADDLDVRLHTHLSETQDENDYCISTFGCRPVDYLEQLGWLSNRVWVAHGIHFTAEEIRRLGDAGVGISHCPTSNMMLSSGSCPVAMLEAAGCAVGLGVDGSASNDCSNMAQEIRQAFLLNRLSSSASLMTHERALQLGTEGSARVIGRTDLGRIETGRQADLALFDLSELRFSGYGDPIAAFVLSGAHLARHVMVAGKWIVREGIIGAVDIAALRHAHQVASEALRTTRLAA